MRDGIIYVRDDRRRHTARDVLDALQLALLPDDTVTLGELCRIIEDRAEQFSFDEEDDSGAG
jgi:hypothetical protein